MAGFSRSLQPPAPDKPLYTWLAWAAQVSFEPRLDPLGEPFTWEHYHAATRARMDLFRAAEDGHFGCALGRDVAMRLGNNAFTPDTMLVGRDRLNGANESFVDHPALVVIEVLLPGCEDQDRRVKHVDYAASGVPEYWIIDPVRKSVELLRLEGGAYRPQMPDADGRYRPAGCSGLVFLPNNLWEGDSHRGPELFVVEQPQASYRHSWSKKGPSWGDLPFRPEPAIEPRPLSFDEFMSWCGRAKFEMIEGRPLIDGRRPTRNVLGMALRTLGLADAVTLLHPRKWLEALAAAAVECNSARLAEWWAHTRRAAAMLRERHGLTRLTVIGDLTRPTPLNIWSDVTLVALDGPKYLPHDAHTELYRMDPEFDINVISLDEATRAERLETDSSGIEV